MSARLRGVAVGAGYFSQFHYDAWQRIEGVEMVALCDADPARAAAAASQYGVAQSYADVAEMLDAEQPDFVDIITPPPTHLPLVSLAAERGIAVICQKALAPTFAEAQQIVAVAEGAGIRFMVHDNFRFQPWHRELKRQLAAGRIGQLHGIACRSRMGDGQGPDAYCERQPYFRDMPQFLIFETGVHLIDVFRFLGGEIASVYAQTRRLNPVIAGEDSALLLCTFTDGATALWDADRVHAPLADNPRYTFGDFLLEGSEGSLALRGDGTIVFHALSGASEKLEYIHEARGFAGDCVHATLAHFARSLRDGTQNELTGADYLRTLAVQEAAYSSASSGAREKVT